MVQDLIISLYHQVLYRSIVATVIGCFILLLRKLTNRRLEPRCNYIIWVIFVIVCIFPIHIPSQFSIYRLIDISVFEENNSQYSNDILNLADDVNESEVYGDVKSKVLENHQKNRKYFAYVVVDICLIVTIVKFGILVCSYIIFNHKIRDGVIKDERIDGIVDECKRNLKIKRKIRIVKQEEMQGPCMIGVFNVRILLTDTTILLNNRELKSIIMHELSHYKRKDVLMNWLIAFVSAMHWFNPMIRRLLLYMKIDMEVATDSLAISKMKDIENKEYCETIVNIAKLCSTKKQYTLGFVSVKDKLLDRVVTIKKKEDFEKHMGLIIISTILIVLFMLVVLCPTSYGDDKEAKLFLESEDGNKINILEENIQLASDSSLRFTVEDGNCKKIIFYDEYNLNTEKHSFGAIQLGDEIYFESGEYRYEFVLECKSGKSVRYSAKILVE